jgi:membrane protein implicated in regulation of membrane protease activity
MSKRKREEKLERTAVTEARKITPGKMIRLLLKSLLFSLLVVAVMVGLNLLGIPAFQNFWIQLGVMVVIYVVAYPFLMREFRPRKQKDRV